MARPRFFLAAVLLLSPRTRAQTANASLITQATLWQDISTLSAYAAQKSCARDCFYSYVGYCPRDNIGNIIGCATHFSCLTQGWQATNSCFCRPDLQTIAQSYLTSCVKKGCVVGDVAIDASSAGGLYAEYCAEKTASPVVPANVLASPTAGGSGGGAGGAAKTGSAGSSPTATGSSTSNTPGATTSSNKLSLGAIIGIAAGGFIGLVLLVSFTRWLQQRFNRPEKPQPYENQMRGLDQTPTYPSPPHSGVYHGQLGTQPELRPGDSVSMVSGPAVFPPTLVSGTAAPRSA